MRKLVLSLAFLMGALMIVVIVERAKTASKNSETEREYAGTVIMADYFGTVAKIFIDEEMGKNCIVVDTETGEITFALIDTTTYIGGEEVAVGDTVRISCEEYSNSDYRPIIEISILE